MSEYCTKFPEKMQGIFLWRSYGIFGTFCVLSKVHTYPLAFLSFRHGEAVTEGLYPAAAMAPLCKGSWHGEAVTEGLYPAAADHEIRAGRHTAPLASSLFLIALQPPCG